MIRLGRFIRLYNKEGFNTSKMIRYALGEVALVVTGILIAVTLNNWNEGRKEKNAVRNSTDIILEELQADTSAINEVLEVYELRRKRFEHILFDSSYAYTDTMSCPGCGLISSFRIFRMNKRGYKRLLTYSDLEYVKKDTFLTQVLELYVIDEELSPLIQTNISDDVMRVLQLWRDEYDWFAPLISGKSTQDYLDYINNSSEYRNMLAYHYILLYQNYIPFLERTKTRAEYLITELEKRRK